MGRGRKPKDVAAAANVAEKRIKKTKEKRKISQQALDGMAAYRKMVTEARLLDPAAYPRKPSVQKALGLCIAPSQIRKRVLEALEERFASYPKVSPMYKAVPRMDKRASINLAAGATYLLLDWTRKAVITRQSVRKAKERADLIPKQAFQNAVTGDHDLTSIFVPIAMEAASERQIEQDANSNWITEHQLASMQTKAKNRRLHNAEMNKKEQLRKHVRDAKKEVELNEKRAAQRQKSAQRRRSVKKAKATDAEVAAFAGNV